VAKQAKTDRQAVIEQLRTQQKSAERRRGLAIVGVCVVVALLIIGLAAFRPIKNWWDLRQFRNVDIDKIGAPASVCGKETTKKATGNQQHVPDGQAIFYPDSPPAFGEHYGTPDPMTRKLYTEGDRPELGVLVHNLEHGYTLAWYRADAPEDEIATLRQAAGTFGSETYDPTQKFIAAPYSSTDGTFPEGKDVVLARWTADPANPSDQTKQQGVRQSCSKVSGQAIADFMAQYPVASSPEPNGA